MKLTNESRMPRLKRVLLVNIYAMMLIIWATALVFDLHAQVDQSYSRQRRKPHSTKLGQCYVLLLMRLHRRQACYYIGF